MKRNGLIDCASASGLHSHNVSDMPVTAEHIKFPLTGGPLRLARGILRYQTLHPLQFIDITDDVEQVVARSGISDGSVTVFSKHTTAAIKIIEHEPELLKDLAQLLTSFAPDSRSYFHNDFTVRWVNLVGMSAGTGMRIASTLCSVQVRPFR
jgi:hypothetical protein